MIIWKILSEDLKHSLVDPDGDFVQIIPTE